MLTGRSPKSDAGYHGFRFVRTDRPLILGHRGASADAPENTCAAFALAREQRADGVECDVMLCGSGELVVCHDHELRRLCGVPWEMRNLPLSALRELPVLKDRFPGIQATIPSFTDA